MSRSLLLVKVLGGRDLRERTLIKEPKPYVSFVLNHEVEVRSALASSVVHKGKSCEWNQLFLFEVGPWWKNKEMMIQVFNKNRLFKDDFVGGVSFLLGDLMTAVGLDDDKASLTSPQHSHNNRSLSDAVSPPPAHTASRAHRNSVIHQPAPLAGSGGAAAHLQQSAAVLPAFEKLSVEDVRSFGELLPILPHAEDDSEPGSDQQQSRGSFSSSSPAFTPSSIASLPLTWLILRHGGGPAKLKQFPLPLWTKPAGKLAIYMDFLTLPPASIPKSPSHSTTNTSQSSTVLPPEWNELSDNEKLAWVYRHRHERRRTVIGGVVGLVAALGSSSHSYPPHASSTLPSSGGSSRTLPPASAPYGAGVDAVGGQRFSVSGRSGAPLLPLSARHDFPFPLTILAAAWDRLQASNMQDRLFYAFFATLGAMVIVTECFFHHQNNTLPTTLSSEEGLSFPQSLSWFTVYIPLLIGSLALRLGWNMLHDAQLSHPWRRLDLVSSLLLGLGLGAGAQMCAAGAWRARVLGVLALATTQGYARARLYGTQVIAGVVAEQQRLAARDGVPLSAISLTQGVFYWSLYSLKTSWLTGLEWVNGRCRSQALPGSIHLSLRSTFFVIGQAAAHWAFLDLPLMNGWGEYATGKSMLVLILPLCGFLLLFLFSKAERIKGKPWLALFALNSVVAAYGAVRLLPVIIAIAFSALAQTLWSNKWGLAGLLVEYFATAVFLPTEAFKAAQLAVTQRPVEPLFQMNYIPHPSAVEGH